ncbi:MULTISPECIES: phage holin, lambda family [Pseudomonas]|uniref:Phage holin, lambda family n=1 Tax=Pseudomonas sp. Hg7Tf TaxID=3236988 RepID=A0AB39IB40_9PSED|nr:MULTISPECIES: phage holin, lambda family [Pseudomonas]MDD1979637.1 phage holin, lambda family [Pseudomonas putida]MDH2558831.1 phage holin, lambda family [Pseudomonas sp. Hg5Tf]
MKILRELFSYTQTQQAKVLGAWVIIPGCLAMAGKEMWNLAVVILEGILCGLIGTSLMPVLEYFSLPTNLAVFAGCMVGFIGVEKLRDYSDRFMSRKADSL